MAVAPVVPVLLIALFTKCSCEPTNGLNYNKGNGATQFGDILRPPPPPPLSIAPVPFHGGVGRLQRQNNDLGYIYQPPPSIATPANTPIPEMNFPAPFYKQYNFNFVPPPQPFSTTPSPTIFQKISGWLFSSQQVSDTGSPINNNILKKDCNPCNSVPWIPVIRYDLGTEKGRQTVNPTYGSPSYLGAEKGRQTINPTYGPPSPTATNDFNTVHNVPQPFQSQSIIYKPTGSPHSSYGPPPASSNKSPKFQSSTYGPPSPTHIVSVLKQSHFNTPYSISSSSLYEPPNISSFPASSYLPSSLYKASSTYRPPTYSYEPQFSSTTQMPISSGYRPEFLNHHLPPQNDIEIISELEPSVDQQLPKVSYPTGFKNSYGEPIINTNILDIPYSVHSDESIKVHSEVSNQVVKSHIPNMSLALANPAPFSSNRGRNIHTLQPVALPNLSVSPLPPIFNARPFRTVPIRYPYNVIQDNLVANNLNIDKSIPIAEYTHLEYPTTVIQSPVIDIDALNKINHTKGYRNIQNSYVIDEVRDISPQASEDHTHISKAKSKLEASFESFGPDFNNDLYDSGIPLEMQQSPNFPHNHKVSFADLRGLKDEDIDKYRTESNLQYIDSPLLYLKPSAPHKNYKNFGFTLSTPTKSFDYEIYDENPTTPVQSTTKGIDNEGKPSSFMKESSPSILAQENVDHNKIVQIIVPYISGQRNEKNKNILSHQHEWILNGANEYQGRKIHSNTENNFESITTEGYKSFSSATEESMSVITDQYESELLNTPPTFNDMYDVKEPPFDIIKLQHNIDDWTAQEYSNHYGTPQRSRSNEKYAKKIPDEYFTTINPITNYPIDTSDSNYDLYDHEVSSSIQHTVTDNKTNIFVTNRKDYNTIERNKNVHESAKNEELEHKKRFHIYTAASFFRSTTSTTTPAPWEQIQTSISPLTNEKVYVVTSKPWRENFTKQYNEKQRLEDQRVDSDETSHRDDLPFKSPRFLNRPYGFTASAMESIKLDSPYGYSNGWHRRINNLENEGDIENGSVENLSDLNSTTIKDI